MVHFARFIFAIMIAGIVVSLALVSFSDMRSRSRQVKAMEEERELFHRLLARYNGQWRSGQVAVEWQKVSGTGEILESSILVRRFVFDPDGKQERLPVRRIIIPGDKLCIDGLSLEFGPLFNEEFKALRGVRLVYFDRVYAEEQPLADRFTFLPRGEVADATQIYSDHISHLEERLWQYLWDLIPSRNDPAATGDRAEKQGLTVRLVAPTCRTVKNGVVYTIFLDKDVTFEESSDPSVLHEILR